MTDETESNVHIFQPKKEPLVTNLALQACGDDELLAELERRGCNIPEIAFQLIQVTCAQRDESWVAKGEPTGRFTIFERAAELCEEAGETAGNAKKIRRLQLGMKGNRAGKSLEELLSDLEYELGDVMVTAANLANCAGVSLWSGLVRAFNTRSEQMGLSEML